ncbi:MAG: MFS transporter [Endozoicomonadaceae bacterium]|nr:MFS transporter [Endozoicomonadaceae bacterium]
MFTLSNQLVSRIPDKEPKQARSWRETVRISFHPRVISMLFLGFSAGLPLLLIFSSLSIWLREADVSRSTVTYFSWAALAYSFKFVWAPLVDRLPLPMLTRWLGRRRSWLLLAQLSIIGSLLFMAGNDPLDNLMMTAIGAIMLGFSSATQDVVIDAYRIEAVDNNWQAMMSSSYITGYRVGMLVAGAGTLKLASGFAGGEDGYHYMAWSLAYLCMAGMMGVGILTTLLIPEPNVDRQSSIAGVYSTQDYLRFLGLFVITVGVFVGGFVLLSTSVVSAKTALNSGPFIGFLVESVRILLCVFIALLTGRCLIGIELVSKQMVRETYIAPFTDFFSRYGKTALFILMLVGSYRVADIVMGVVANVFYSDMGFTKDQIANITKTFGLLMTIAGGFVGGVLTIRFGVLRILWVGALLAAVTNLLFALLAGMAPQSLMLAVVIAADNLSGGIATAAFIAYLSGLTNRAFTAMQYAIFSSLMTLLPKVLGGYSGSMVDALGYQTFFIVTAVMGLPVLALVSWIIRLERR